MCPRTFRFEKNPLRCGSSSGLQYGSGTSLMWYVWMNYFSGLGVGRQPLRMLEGGIKLISGQQSRLQSPEGSTAGSGRGQKDGKDFPAWEGGDGRLSLICSKKAHIVVGYISLRLILHHCKIAQKSLKKQHLLQNIYHCIHPQTDALISLPLSNSFICTQQKVLAMKSSELKGEWQFVRISIDFGKQKLRLKLPIDTKVLYFQEFLRREIKVTATESLYLFERSNRKLMIPAKPLAEYVRDPTPSEVMLDNPKKERVLHVIVRKTDSF